MCAVQVLKWCNAGVCAGQCRCVCSAGAKVVQCRCVCRAVLKWCSAVQVGYMGHMGLCVISVKKLDS